MALKLKYFNINGFGEALRYILHYQGKQFLDQRYEGSSWPIKKVQDALPYGKMPVLQENGRVLNQSIAIARYLAAGTELLPTDPWEQAKLDSVILTMYDFAWNLAYKAVQEPDPVLKEAALKKLMSEDLEYYFSRFEKILKENQGHFAGKLSWADFVFDGVTECCNLLLHENLEQNYPAIKKLMQEIQSLPGVKEYVATRNPYSM